MSSFSRVASDIFDFRNWTSLCESSEISVIVRDSKEDLSIHEVFAVCLHVNMRVPIATET